MPSCREPQHLAAPRSLQAHTDGPKQHLSPPLMQQLPGVAPPRAGAVTRPLAGWQPKEQQPRVLPLLYSAEAAALAQHHSKPGHSWAALQGVRPLHEKAVAVVPQPGLAKRQQWQQTPGAAAQRFAVPPQLLAAWRLPWRLPPPCPFCGPSPLVASSVVLHVLFRVPPLLRPPAPASSEAGIATLPPPLASAPRPPVCASQMPPPPCAVLLQESQGAAVPHDAAPVLRAPFSFSPGLPFLPYSGSSRAAPSPSPTNWE
mmetsp:Transcript_81178/g.160959  ORF Transcript_81178/g.160959 Transcript_81178/m.160959 type:complete len:258 (+) Transcript_81178:380-1153(+)